MFREIDGNGVLRYIQGYADFLKQAEEEEETVIESDLEDDGAYNLNGYCLGDLE